MFESNCQPIIIDNKKYVIDSRSGEMTEILQDFSRSGTENPHSYNKRMTNYLSLVYKELHKQHKFDFEPDFEKVKLSSGRFNNFSKTSTKLSYCSNYLEMIHLKDKTKHISYIESCHSSLCPSCNFFRARNNLRNMICVLEDFFSDYSNLDYPFVFLTLTVPDCSGSELRSTIKAMNKAFHKFLNYKEVKSAVIGCSRSFEVTVNNDEDSNSYGLFHPHFHVLMVMQKDYFLFHKCRDDDKYMNRLQWLMLWQRALGLHNFRSSSNQYQQLFRHPANA